MPSYRVTRKDHRIDMLVLSPIKFSHIAETLMQLHDLEPFSPGILARSEGVEAIIDGLNIKGEAKL
ncbi:MAG: hypothetical protein AABX71_03100 [Nanoarchaeota archaeon]